MCIYVYLYIAIYTYINIYIYEYMNIHKGYKDILKLKLFFDYFFLMDGRQKKNKKKAGLKPAQFKLS